MEMSEIWKDKYRVTLKIKKRALKLSSGSMFSEVLH